MKRTAIAVALFVFFIAVLTGIPFLLPLRRISEARATGIGLVLGSPVENFVRLAILLLLGILTFWFSGKLVRS
jgi:hypothetical protein